MTHSCPTRRLPGLARTRTLFRREAGRIGGAARKNKPPSPSSSENSSALRREAQQPLLHRRGEQRAGATIDRAALEAAAAPRPVPAIGRASGRARVWRYVELYVYAEHLKKKQHTISSN